MFLLPLPLPSRPSSSKGSTTSNGSNQQRQRELHTVSSIINNALLAQLGQECQLQPDCLRSAPPSPKPLLPHHRHLATMPSKSMLLPLIPPAQLRNGWPGITPMPGSHWLEFVVLIINSNLQKALDPTGNQLSWNVLCFA